jgi:Spy/CpxP family protein refolding chaperone
LIPVKRSDFDQVHSRNDETGERTMQHKMKTGIRRAGAAVGLVAAVAVSGAAIGHGNSGADSHQGGMMGTQQMGQNSGMMMGGHHGNMMTGEQGGMGLGMMGGGQGRTGPGMMKSMMGGGMMSCPMMGGAAMGTMHEILEPEQRKEMRNLMQEHRPAHFEKMGRMMNLRDDLMAEMQQSRPDPEAVKKRHARMAELHGEMMAEMVRMRNAMQDILTDQQRQQLREGTPKSDGGFGEHEDHH